MKKCCKWHNNLDDEGIDCGLAGMGNREDSFCCKRCPERLIPIYKVLNKEEAKKKPIFMGIQKGIL